MKRKLYKKLSELRILFLINFWKISNFFLKKDISKVKFIIEKENWAIKTVGTYISKSINRKFENFMSVSRNPEKFEDKIEVLTALSSLDSVAGRFQYMTSKTGITAIVDYAHTPDALENVLKTIGSIRTRNEQVFTIVGCGGDRDKTKRPKMAGIACKLSDKVIITSDNPRTEEPQAIIDDMMTGVEGQHFKKTLSVTDRAQAIKTAVSIAEKGDIILIAGKGHENYQEINGVKHHFDDMEIVNELFIKMEK